MILFQLLFVLLIMKGYAAMICEQDSRDIYNNYGYQRQHIIKCHNASLDMEELLLLPDADASKQATYRIEFLQGNISVLHSSRLIISYRYRIHSLKIENSLLKHIEPGAFRGLNDLQDLSLSKNNLTEINAGIFKPLTNLKVLNVSYNQINRIENNSFDGMLSLTVMDLSKNKLEIVSSFENLSNLTHLNISSNNLSFIEINCFRNLQSLIQLDLSQNFLTTLELGAFSDLASLQYLNVSYNNLAIVDFQYSLSKLRELSINNNNISSIDIFDINQYCPELRSIILYGNPFECSTLMKINRDLMINKIKTIPGPWTGPNINGIECNPTSTPKPSLPNDAKNHQSEQAYQTFALELNKTRTELAMFMKDVINQLQNLNDKFIDMHL